MSNFIPLSTIPTATVLARLFIQHVFRLHGLPVRIVSDRGSQITARFWTALCKLLQIDPALSSEYHPESNGQTERANQVIETYLCLYSNHHQSDWERYLPVAEFACNNALHFTLGDTPFHVSYGYHPRLLPLLLPSTDVPAATAITSN